CRYATRPDSRYTLSLHDALPIYATRNYRTMERHGGSSSPYPNANPRRPKRQSLNERLTRPRRTFYMMNVLDAGHARSRKVSAAEIGRAHVRTPVTFRPRMPASAG